MTKKSRDDFFVHLHVPVCQGLAECVFPSVTVNNAAEIRTEEDVPTRILRCAAELIYETGGREIDIPELARRTGVKRSNVYAHFGDEGDVKMTIYQTIIRQFLTDARQLIEGALVANDPRFRTPIERLAAVFHSTLAAFKRDPAFGRVVLLQLNLGKTAESASAFEIFVQVDSLLQAARDAGELNEQILQHLACWKIRQVIFGVAWALLRAVFLDEGKRVDSSGMPIAGDKFSESEIETEVLRVVQLYTAEPSSRTIQAMIDKIIAQRSEAGTSAY